jgi:hypothetical protein
VYLKENLIFRIGSGNCSIIATKYWFQFIVTHGRALEIARDLSVALYNKTKSCVFKVKSIFLNVLTPVMKVLDRIW